MSKDDVAPQASPKPVKRIKRVAPPLTSDKKPEELAKITEEVMTRYGSIVIPGNVDTLFADFDPHATPTNITGQSSPPNTEGIVFGAEFGADTTSGSKINSTQTSKAQIQQSGAERVDWSSDNNDYDATESGYGEGQRSAGDSNANQEPPNLYDSIVLNADVFNALAGPTAGYALSSQNGEHKKYFNFSEDDIVANAFSADTQAQFLPSFRQKGLDRAFGSLDIEEYLSSLVLPDDSLHEHQTAKKRHDESDDDVVIFNHNHAETYLAYDEGVFDVSEEGASEHYSDGLGSLPLDLILGSFTKEHTANLSYLPFTAGEAESSPTPYDNLTYDVTALNTSFFELFSSPSGMPNSLLWPDSEDYFNIYSGGDKPSVEASDDDSWKAFDVEVDMIDLIGLLGYNYSFDVSNSGGQSTVIVKNSQNEIVNSMVVNCAHLCYNDVYNMQERIKNEQLHDVLSIGPRYGIFAVNDPEPYFKEPRMSVDMKKVKIAEQLMENILSRTVGEEIKQEAAKAKKMADRTAGQKKK